MSFIFNKNPPVKLHFTLITTLEQSQYEALGLKTSTYEFGMGLYNSVHKNDFDIFKETVQLFCKIFLNLGLLNISLSL